MPRLAVLLAVFMTLLPVAPLVAGTGHGRDMDCCEEMQAAPCHSALRAMACCQTPEAPAVTTASASVSVMPERSVLRKQQAAPAQSVLGARSLVVVSAFERRQGRVAPLPPFLLDRALLL
ncbi:MAG: hypothetical protein Q8L86_20915 [Vicinamibacterales bacterium]|nr:hypothetical protein [Vicinamibacterales bacterium]